MHYFIKQSLGNSFAKATLEPISTSVLSGGGVGMRSISPMPRANLSLPLNTSNLLGRTLGNSTVLVCALLFYFNFRSNRDHPLRKLTRCLNSVMDTHVRLKNRRKSWRASANVSMKFRSPSDPTAKSGHVSRNPTLTAPPCPKKSRP